SRLVAREAWGPAWSPHGAELAFVSSRGGGVRIVVVRADGSGARPFGSETAADVEGLAWSPRGNRLAYTAEAGGGTRQLVVDTGRARTVVPVAGSDPVWSPDGTRLAVATSGGVELVTPNGSWRVARGPGRPLDWRVVPLGRPRFPDLVQRPPSGL